MPRFVNHERSAAIGARLCLARVTAGLSRRELGSALGLCFQMIEKYESGRSRLPAVMLPDLARLLDRPPLFFIATDRDAIAEAALLRLPDDVVLARQLDRALATLGRSPQAPQEAA